MLAANRLTQNLLAQASGMTVQEYALEQSAQSMRRFVEKINREYEPTGLRVEYDGQTIRCLTLDGHSFEERLRSHEADLASLDPLCSGAPYPGLLSAINDGVVWWYDLKHLASRYRHLKDQVTTFAVKNNHQIDQPKQNSAQQSSNHPAISDCLNGNGITSRIECVSISSMTN